MPTEVIALILSLCGAGNPTSCRHDMTDCYKRVFAEEAIYGHRVDQRESDRGGCFGHGKKYPDAAIVYECAMDLGVPFDRPVIPDEEPALEAKPETVRIQDIPENAAVDPTDIPSFDETDPAE